MRRKLSPVLALALLALTVGFVSPMSASARPVRATAGSCDSTQSYPPAPDATVQVSTTNPSVGEKIKVSGIHYCPDEDVDITIAGDFVATAHTDAAGSFDPVVKVPGPPGDKQVCGIGASGLSTDRDCLTIHVTAAGGTTHQPSQNGGGTPAMTGVEIALLGLLALILVVSGVVLATLGRRRRITAGV